jgi:hypothetical protein
MIALTIGFTKQKTGLHDMLCKTRVLCGAPLLPSAIVNGAPPARPYNN